MTLQAPFLLSRIASAKCLIAETTQTRSTHTPKLFPLYPERKLAPADAVEQGVAPGSPLRGLQVNAKALIWNDLATEMMTVLFLFCCVSLLLVKRRVSGRS